MIPITSFAQAWSRQPGTATAGVRLHADERDNLGWKKFASLETSTDPYISFT